MIRRRFSTWLMLGTICVWQLGFCHAQKDSSFGDGAKSGNNAFQTSQKGSELGGSPPRNVASAGRPPGNVRAIQTQSASGDETETAPSAIQNASPPAARPSLGAAGNGLPGGSHRNGNVGAALDRSPNIGPVVHAEQQSNTPNPADQPEQEQDGPPQPQLPLRPQTQPQSQAEASPQAQLPRARPPASGRGRGGTSANVGEDGSNLATTPSVNLATGDGVGEATATAPILNTAAPAGTIHGIGQSGSGAGSNKGKAAKVRHGNNGGSSAGVGSTAGSGSESGDGAIKIGGTSGAVGEAPGSTPKPRAAGGLVPNRSGEEAESEPSRGPPGATPNAPPLPAGAGGVGAGAGNGRIPADGAAGGGLRPVAAAGPQLSPRSPGAPSPPPPLQPQAPLEPTARTATPAPTASGGAAGQSAEGGEEAASSALIKAVNDEYVDVVKNLTDAGVLTEADYESKPVSDLFAILLEKLINANPDATEEDQRHLVRQAGVEFVEVFKANAASTKNVSEIVRLVNEQLQSAPIILNEGHPEAGLGGAGSGSLVEPTTPASNPLDATAEVRFGSPGRSSHRGPQVNGEVSPAPNASLASGRSGQPTRVSGQQSSSNAAGSTRRPVVGGAGIQPLGGEATFPSPPGNEGDLNQSGSTPSSILEASTEKGITRHNFGLLPFAGSGSLSGASSPSPVPGFGFQNVPSVSRVGGSSNTNSQFASTHDVSGTNGTNAAENGTNLQGSSAEISITTQEPAPEGPVLIPVGNPRFPFPAHAPSTLRPPLRFFTTSSVATTGESGGGPQQPLPGIGRGEFGASETHNQSPFVVTAAPPSFVPFGRNPAPSPTGGRVVIGGASGVADSSSEGSPLGTDFPLPPTWEFNSGSTLGPLVIGAGGAGSTELNEGPKTVTFRPFESGIFGIAANSTSGPGFGSSSTLLGREPALGNNTTELPLITTTSEEAEAPFTHEVHDIFGNNFQTKSSSGAPVSAPNANATTANTSDGGFLVFGGGLQANSNVPTSGPSTRNTTESGEAFVTESGEDNETISSAEGPSSIRASAEVTPASPSIIPGVESGIVVSNLSNNGTNASSVLAPFIPGQSISISTTRPGLESSSSSFGIETTLSSRFGEVAQTSSTFGNAATTSGALVIGSERENGTGVFLGSESTTTSREPLLGPGSSTEGIEGISSGNESSRVSSAERGSGSSAVTASGIEVSTTEEIEGGSGSGELSNDTTEHGSSGGIGLPTRPLPGNATEVPGDEGESSTSSSGATSGTSSNPVLIWSFRIIDPQTTWDSELLNKESFQYKELHSSLITDLRTLFKTLEAGRFVDVTIKRFSKGSVIVDGQTELRERVDSAQLLDSFVKLVGEHKNTIGGRAVDPSSITFDRHQQYASQASSGNTASAGGTPNWVIGLVVAVVLLALIIIAAVVVIKRRKRQASRDHYMVDEETMNGGPKSWQPRNANQPAEGQQRGNGLSNGRDQYSGVNMYEMKEPAVPNAHMNYGYQPDRPANGHGAHGRSVTEIHINAETNVDGEASSKH